MRIWAGAATVMMMAAVPAAAQVTLEANQETMLQLTSGTGGIKAVPRPATLTSYDRDFVEQTRGNVPTGDNVYLGKPAPGITLPAIEPNAIIMRFVVVDGPEGKKESVLVIENGYGQGITYRARISVGEKSGATDVCLVMPGKRGYELWPYAIDKIELAAFELVPWQNGDPIPCR